MAESTPTQAPTSTTTTTTTPATNPKRILLLNGPNLNLLGHREPQIYGTTTLPSLLTHLTTISQTHSITLTTYQSNHEGALVDRIHRCLLSSDPEDKVDAIIINPGAYTHTSVAIRDAILGVGVPFVEVHISNVHAREEFRRHSYLSDKAQAVICGLGVFGYVAAVEFWAWRWKGGKLEDAGVYGQ